MIYKEEGFKNQKSIKVDARCIKTIQADKFHQHLYLTDIGYYPEAVNHFRIRSFGADEHILIYCSEGAGWVELAGTKYPIEKFQYCILPAHTPHSYGANMDNPWTIYWAHFQGSSASAFINKKEIVRCLSPASSAMSQKVNMLYNDLYAYADESNIENNKLAGAALWHWLMLITTPQQPNKHNKRINNMVEKALIYMQENTHHRISLASMAKHLNCSASNFSALFKKHTAQSPIDYFNYLKIQQACQLLDFSADTIANISASLGFEDSFYFSRLFRKKIGVSPQQYRMRGNK
jgi:AraC-like DNA-binding protein